MPTATGLTAARVTELLADNVIRASINEAGKLIMTTRSGLTFDAGKVREPSDVSQFVLLREINEAQSMALEVNTLAKEAEYLATESRLDSSKALATTENTLSRLENLEVVGGLAEGDVSDATMTSIASNPESNFGKFLDNQLVAKGIVWRTPQDYGAKGDGITDDANALNAWADAGGFLKLPPGFYVHDGVTRPRITKSNTILVGSGENVSRIISNRTYKTGGTGTYLFIAGGGGSMPELNNISISDVGFMFTGMNEVRGGDTPLLLSRIHNLSVTRVRTRYGSIGMLINRAHNFEISHCEVSDTMADGIQGDGGTDTIGTMTLKNGRIHDNYVHDTRDDCIAMGGKQDGELVRRQPENIRVYDNTLEWARVNGGGVGFYGIKSGQIARNRIRDTISAFITIRMDAIYNQYPSEEVEITDNVGRANTPLASIVANKSCISLGTTDAAFSGSEMDIPIMRSIIIARNYFEANDRQGIYCRPHAASMNANPNKWLRDITLDDNTFIYTGPMTAATKAYTGINLAYIRGLDIKRNTVRGYPAQAMVLNQFTGLKVRGNEFENCLMHTENYALDLVVIGNAGTATDTLDYVVNNEFRRTSGSVNRMVSIRADGSGGNYVYEGNHFFTTGATVASREFFQSRPTIPVTVAQSAWDRGHLKLGNYALWVDSNNRLRMKNGIPISETDGAIIGAQS